MRASSCHRYAAYSDHDLSSHAPCMHLPVRFLVLHRTATFLHGYQIHLYRRYLYGDLSKTDMIGTATWLIFLQSYAAHHWILQPLHKNKVHLPYSVNHLQRTSLEYHLLKRKIGVARRNLQSVYVSPHPHLPLAFVPRPYPPRSCKTKEEGMWDCYHVWRSHEWLHRLRNRDWKRAIIRFFSAPRPRAFAHYIMECNVFAALYFLHSKFNIQQLVFLNWCLRRAIFRKRLPQKHTKETASPQCWFSCLYSTPSHISYLLIVITD